MDINIAGHLSSFLPSVIKQPIDQCIKSTICATFGMEYRGDPIYTFTQQYDIVPNVPYISTGETCAGGLALTKEIEPVILHTKSP